VPVIVVSSPTVEDIAIIDWKVVALLPTAVDVCRVPNIVDCVVD
jgi:hypothetical protein